jgi:hypothetical protein
MGYSGSLEFAAGETFQFDWGENYALIDRRKNKLQVAHFKLSRSRAYILRAYPAQSHETNYNDCLVNFLAPHFIPLQSCNSMQPCNKFHQFV